MKAVTKTHDEMIREEAMILRHMVLKAGRRARVLRLARKRRGKSMSVRSRILTEVVA